MFPICIRYIGDRELAEDVLQDGFITLFSKLQDYKGDGSFEGWARKIFVNTALMSLRKKDALKMSEELEAVRGMRDELPSQNQNIGYKELMGYIKGQESLDASVERLKMATRRYAKRQITWFSSKSYVTQLDVCSAAGTKTFEEIVNIAESLFFS
jgi:RNA polymerase sigma factor (sigma-70 family)